MLSSFTHRVSNRVSPGLPPVFPVASPIDPRYYETVQQVARLQANEQTMQTLLSESKEEARVLRERVAELEQGRVEALRQRVGLLHRENLHLKEANQHLKVENLSLKEAEERLEALRAQRNEFHQENLRLRDAVSKHETAGVAALRKQVAEQAAMLAEQAATIAEQGDALDDLDCMNDALRAQSADAHNLRAENARCVLAVQASVEEMEFAVAGLELTLCQAATLRPRAPAPSPLCAFTKRSMGENPVFFPVKTGGILRGAYNWDEAETKAKHFEPYLLDNGESVPACMLGVLPADVDILGVDQRLRDLLAVLTCPETQAFYQDPVTLYPSLRTIERANYKLDPSDPEVTVENKAFKWVIDALRLHRQ